MAHINVSIFCSLRGPTEGPLLQRGAKFPSCCSVMTVKMTYNNLYDAAVLEGGVLQHGVNLAQRKHEKIGSKQGKEDFPVEAAVLWLVPWSRHPRLECRLLTSLRRWECVWTETRTQHTHAHIHSRILTKSEDYFHFNSTQTLLLMNLRWMIYK